MAKKKSKELKKQTGPKSPFTPELLDRLFTAIDEGKSARWFFTQQDTPWWSEWCKWKRKPENKAILDQYTDARMNGFEVWEERIRERAADDTRDVIENVIEFVDKEGNVTKRVTQKRSDNTAVNRDRLTVDTDKWLMSKLAHGIYGEKVSQEHTGNITITPVINYKPKLK